MPVSFPRRSGNQPQRVEMFSQWATRFPNANGNIASAVAALVEGYKALREHQAKLAADETNTPGARLVKTAKAARAKIIPLVENLAAANQIAAQHASQLEMTMTRAYRPAEPKYHDTLRHAEIRAHFKGLSNNERLKVLDEARKAGDEDTLIAIASCQAYLSGIQPQVQEMYRNHLVEVYAPKEAAAVKAIREQQGYAEQMREAMLQSVADLVDFQKADELIAAATDELAA